MHLDTIYFDFIKQKIKLYETRVYDAKRQQIKLLDKVNFHDRGSKRTFTALITELSWFKNLKKQLNQ